jgi:membrane-associated phospholipid phosphatase
MDSRDGLNSSGLRFATKWQLLGAFLLSLLVLLVSSEVFTVNETSCSTGAWCATNAFDRAITERVAQTDSRDAALVSHVFSLGITVILALGSALWPLTGKEGGVPRHHAWQDVVVVLSVVTVSIAVNTAFKVSFSRQRPCFYYNATALSEFSNTPSEEFKSFYSGDTTVGCTVAGISIALATLRRRWYAQKFGFVIGCAALIGSFLRIVAYVHWTTDVLTGVFLGFGFGFAPLLVCKQPAVHRLSEKFIIIEIEKGHTV